MTKSEGMTKSERRNRRRHDRESFDRLLSREKARMGINGAAAPSACAAPHPSASATRPRAPMFPHRRAADQTRKARSPSKACDAERDRSSDSGHWFALLPADATPPV